MGGLAGSLASGPVLGNRKTEEEIVIEGEFVVEDILGSGLVTRHHR